MDAWAAAYGFLAEVLIEAEEALREGNRRKRHGWAGWREMSVLRKVCGSRVLGGVYGGWGTRAQHHPALHAAYRLTATVRTIHQHSHDQVKESHNEPLNPNPNHIHPPTSPPFTGEGVE